MRGGVWEDFTKEEELSLTLKERIGIRKESHKNSKAVGKIMVGDSPQTGQTVSAESVNLGIAMFIFPAQNAVTQFYACSFMKMKSVK